MSDDLTTKPKLLPCPFCGGQPEVIREGTRRYSTIIACSNCGCRLESGNEGDQYGDAWNSRHPPEARECKDCDKLMTERDFAEATCDKLVHSIECLHGEEFGEHSSGNFPWENAIEFLETAIDRKVSHEPSGWQPIETAPRDGSRILLCANLQVKDRIGAGRYSVEPYISDGRGIIGAAEGFQGDGDQCIPSNQDVFTHWMPLPSAPVTKGETP